MFSSSVVLWILIAVGFLVLEGCTVALVSIWFAAGAIAALIPAVLGMSMVGQTAVFLLVSGGLLCALRPMLRKHVKITKTNVDSVIGSKGYVTQEIDNIASTGQVKLGAMTWTARSTDDSRIPAGAQVQVEKIEGVKVFVSVVHEPAVP